MPAAIAASSPPPVNTNWPFFAFTIAVPVSWHIGKHAAGGDGRVLQQVEGDEAVVVAGLRIVEDGAQLGEVIGPQEVGDVAHRLRGQPGDRLGLDAQERPGRGVERRHPLGGQQPVRRVVRTEREQFGVLEAGVGHGATVSVRGHVGRI